MQPEESHQNKIDAIVGSSNIYRRAIHSALGLQNPGERSRIINRPCGVDAPREGGPPLQETDLPERKRARETPHVRASPSPLLRHAGAGSSEHLLDKRPVCPVGGGLSSTDGRAGSLLREPQPHHFKEELLPNITTCEAPKEARNLVVNKNFSIFKTQ